MEQRVPDDRYHEPRGVIGIVAGARALSPAQRKFNELIERIGLQREEFATWRAFREHYQQRLAEHYQPALARLRDMQVDMARLLDRILEGKGLGRHERAKTRDMLVQILSALLLNSQDAEVVELYDKYAERSFGDEQQERLKTLRSLASEEFNVDEDAIPGGQSADDLAEWIDEQLRARSEQTRNKKPRKKSAKTLASEALRAETEQNGTRAVREVFRKLASELHPDRETDPAEQARKTELMQRVNQAYKAGDLLTLLELQFSIEQIDPKALASLAEDRLQHYIQVLEGQSQRLREELLEFLTPFAIEGKPMKKLSAASVERRLELDIREIRAVTRGLEADLRNFQNIEYFRRSLRDYEGGPSYEDDLEMPARSRPRPRGRQTRPRGNR